MTCATERLWSRIAAAGPVRWLAIGTVALIPACGGGADAGEAAAVATAEPAATADQPSGTLTLGDRTFEFRVSRCDLSDAEATSSDEMLRGSGTLENGERFSLYLDRQAQFGREVHSVSLYSGAPRTGFFVEARNGVNPTGADEPIISIDGRTVRAKGIFDVDDAGEESAVEGELEATCPA